MLKMVKSKHKILFQLNLIIDDFINLDKECLSIENKINDSIGPIPEYQLDIDENLRTISLKVFETCELINSISF